LIFDIALRNLKKEVFLNSLLKSKNPGVDVNRLKQRLTISHLPLLSKSINAVIVVSDCVEGSQAAEAL